MSGETRGAYAAVVSDLFAQGYEPTEVTLAAVVDAALSAWLGREMAGQRSLYEHGSPEWHAVNVALTGLHARCGGFVHDLLAKADSSSVEQP